MTTTTCAKASRLCSATRDTRREPPGMEREALTVLDSLDGAPCILLLDLDMPVMSGLEVLEVLSNRRCLGHLPVIVCSGIAVPPTLPIGVRRYLRKPMALDVLLTGLHEACMGEAPLQSLVMRSVEAPTTRTYGT